MTDRKDMTMAQHIVDLQRIIDEVSRERDDAYHLLRRLPVAALDRLIDAISVNPSGIRRDLPPEISDAITTLSTWFTDAEKITDYIATLGTTRQARGGP